MSFPFYCLVILSRENLISFDDLDSPYTIYSGPALVVGELDDRPGRLRSSDFIVQLEFDFFFFLITRVKISTLMYKTN